MKIFFVFFIFLCLSAVGFSFLYMFGFLPTSVYSFVYKVEETLVPVFSPPVPYTQKFEGHWSIKLVPATAFSDVTLCNTIEGVMRVRNGVVYGNLARSGGAFVLSGRVNHVGVFTGVFGARGGYSATLTGMLSAGHGDGEWKDTFDCYGTAVFTKQGAVVDPSQGYVVSMKGVVTLVRGGVSSEPSIRETLYADDQLTVAPGGTVLLSMGVAGQAITVQGGTGYTVPSGIKF